MKIAYISDEKASVLGNNVPVNHFFTINADTGVLDDSDIFLIDSRDHHFAQAACKVVRSHSVPAIYLKPIIAVNADGETASEIEAMTDEVFTTKMTSALELRYLAETGIKINRRIEKLSGLHDKTDTGVAQKILRYLFTRQKELVPFRNAQNRFGLHYPEIEALINTKDDSLFHVLDFLETQHLLNSDFYEKVHQCNHCNSSLLNFIEICPHCSSGDLETDDLIHHFHCAHVAPAKKFKTIGGYVCPKCDKTLGGLGVDYDKPSTVYKCNRCKHVSQEPEVSTTCFTCGTHSLPEDLVVKTIKKYTLSSLGENSAINGIDIMFQQILDQAINILPYQMFKVFLEAEIERIKRYGISRSSIILFYINEFDKLYGQMGNRSKEIFGEMGVIMKSVLRNCDITTIVNETTFISLLPETDNNGAKTAIERLKEKFTHLFETNLDRKIDIITNTLELSGTKTVSDVLTEVLEDGTSD